MTAIGWVEMPAAARFQVKRIASERKLAEADVARLVEDSIQPAPLGVLGDPRVNVLKLNLQLDKLAPGTKPPPAPPPAPAPAAAPATASPPSTPPSQ